MGRSQWDRTVRSKATRARGIQKKAATVGGLTDLPIVVLHLDESGKVAGFQSHKGLIRHLGLDQLIKNPSNPQKILNPEDMQKLLAKRQQLLGPNTQQSPFQFISTSDEADQLSSPTAQSTRQISEGMTSDSSESNPSTPPPSVSPSTRDRTRARQLFSFFPQSIPFPLQ